LSYALTARLVDFYKDRPNLARFLYSFRLYEVTVAVALFVYVVVFIVFLCVVS